MSSHMRRAACSAVTMLFVCRPAYSDAADVGFSYVCPETNTVQVWHSGAVGPKVVTAVYGLPLGGAFVTDQRSTDWEHKSCSTADTLCVSVVEFTKTAATSIAIPRTLEAGKTFNVKGVNVSVTTALAGVAGSRRVEVLIQGKTSDPSNASTRLVIEEGRGVLYWYGRMFWEPDSGRKQTCVLEGGRGLFSEARIAKSTGPKTNRVD